MDPDSNKPNIKRLSESFYYALGIREYYKLLFILLGIVTLRCKKMSFFFLAALGLCCCTRAFSSCGERVLLFIAVCRLLITVLQWLLLWSTGSRRAGFSSCGTRARYLWCTGLVAQQHVGSSQTRARTRVPCIGRWILNHCATREVPRKCLFLEMYTYVYKGKMT